MPNLTEFALEVNSELGTELNFERIKSSNIGVSNYVATPWHYTVTNSSIRGFETVKAHVEPAKMRIANFKEIDWVKME